MQIAASGPLFLCMSTFTCDLSLSVSWNIGTYSWHLIVGPNFGYTVDLHVYAFDGRDLSITRTVANMLYTYI